MDDLPILSYSQDSGQGLATFDIIISQRLTALTIPDDTTATRSINDKAYL